MPVPTPLRYSHAMSPPNTLITPSRQPYAKSSNSSSYSPTIISGGQSKMNIVTRIALEGKAKRGQEGASIKLYLKISLPLENITPGSTIPLFPEENIKILTSQVHPLDSNSAPYNFSSTISPLLHKAARALNLPARTSESFHTAYKIPITHSNSSVHSNNRAKNTESIEPVDLQYTGHILVSGYYISFVLPKSFPSQRRPGASPSDNESDGFAQPSRTRGFSLLDKPTVQFMAAIDMWVPYVTRPPRAPYLLSIPIPRCLHNHIKLRIFSPSAPSSSLASLSSIEEEVNTWDLTSDPHVTRNAPSRPSRTRSYTHFADDETSDSSATGLSDGYGIQGTFPSAERIRIRWAKPLKNVGALSEESSGRRRVGVKEAKGEMVCTIKGKVQHPDDNRAEGLLMNVEYKGTCKGVWFPGVATLLGLDVGLEAKGSDVSWVSGSPSTWEVGGGIGYTGFDVGPPPTPINSESQTSLIDSGPQIVHTDERAQQIKDEQTNTSSLSSLLRAPLPAHTVAEYSFEGSTIMHASSSPPGTMSSMSSFPNSTPNISESSQTRPPGTPITLHVNMNDLIPPAKNTFNFTISGTILITPRTTLARTNGQRSVSRSPSPNRGSDSEEVLMEPIVLPRFTVLAADSEITTFLIRNDVEGVAATVEVFNPSGDTRRDPQTRKTVLQKGGYTKCGEEGGRIALKSVFSIANGHRSSRSQIKVLNGKLNSRTPSNTSLARIYHTHPKREGPMVLPSVKTKITMLLNGSNSLPSSYAVRLCLHVPAHTGSESIEFGLAKSDLNSSPQVNIANATIDGEPTKFKVTPIAPKEHRPSDIGVSFEEMSGKEWVSWVTIDTGKAGGMLTVDYVVQEKYGSKFHKSKWKIMRTRREERLLHILLPTFSLPVGRMETKIHSMSGWHLSPLCSNFEHQHDLRLLQYSVEGFFNPRLTLIIRPIMPTQYSYVVDTRRSLVLSWIFCLVMTTGLYRAGTEIRRLGNSLEQYSTDFNASQNGIPALVTVTTTIYSERTLWLANDGPTPTSTATISPTSSLASITATPSVMPETPDSSSSKRESQWLPDFLSPVEEYGLSPVQHIFTFSWLDQDARAEMHAGVQKVVRTMEALWQIFRKVYHYPLEPPP